MKKRRMTSPVEMRIFENYEKVKYEIIKVIDFLTIRNISHIGLRF